MEKALRSTTIRGGRRSLGRMAWYTRQTHAARSFLSPPIVGADMAGARGGSAARSGTHTRDAARGRHGRKALHVLPEL
jgi:hypothetical protein